MQKILIDLSGNPELQAALENKDPQEDCELTLKLETISADANSFEGSVKEILYEYEGEEMSIEPTVEEPASMSIFTDLMEEDEDAMEEGTDMALEIEVDETEGPIE